MSNPTPIQFSTQTYQHRSPNVQAEKTLNLYPEVDPNNSSNPILIGCAGTSVFTEIPNFSSCRGIHTTATGRVFAVYGGVVYEIGSNGVILRQFNISGLPTAVDMTDNGTYLVIVDRVSMYCFNLDLNTLVPVDIQSDLDGPTGIIYLAGFFYAIDESNRFYFSDINLGPVVWPALNFAEAESSADALVSISLRASDVILQGEQSTEVWRISGNDRLPIVPVVTSNVGCSASRSVAVINDTLFFLGSNTNGSGMIFAMSGNSPEIVSNPAISYLLSQAGTDLSGAYACAYQQEGHSFYCLSLPSIEKTICYDTTTQMWHERGSRDPLTNITRRWDVAFTCFAFGRVLCGNLRADNPAVLTLSLDKYDEYDGRTIQRIHQSPIYGADGATLFFDAFEIDLETGVGTQTGQGANPQIMLDYSDDTHTWSSQLFGSLGRIGEYFVRVRWSRLGRARFRIFRITISDPVKVVIKNGRIWYSTGANR